MASAPVTSAVEIRRAMWLYDWDGAAGPMHTDSSASRTCRLSRSASLNTATVAIRSSRQARMMRRAISPRFAISTFRNMRRSVPRHPVGLAATAAHRLGAGTGALAHLVRVDRLPHPVRRGRDALELERQLVRVVAVLDRLFLADQPVAQQLEHRLIEGLHAVLGHAFGDRG